VHVHFRMQFHLYFAVLSKIRTHESFNLLFGFTVRLPFSG